MRSTTSRSSPRPRPTCRRACRSAREALRLANRRYEAGYSGYLEVLESQRQTNTSEILLIRKRQALLSADVDLMTALGGGWQPARTAAAK